jgi:hypothetical protein
MVEGRDQPDSTHSWGNEMKRSITAIFLATAVLGVAACGAGTSSDKQSPGGAIPAKEVSSDSTARPSGFYAQADAICKQMQSELTASLQAQITALKAGLPAPQAREQQHADEEAARRSGLQKLEALTPPEASRTAYRDYLGVQRQRLVLAPWRATSAAERQRVITQREQVDHDGIFMAKQLGFGYCT